MINEGLLAILRSRFAVLPGVRDRDHRPLIFLFFENQPPNMTVEHLHDLIVYFFKITLDETHRNKFAFVVDMRHGSTSNNLKSLLKVLEDEFVSYVGAVYVIKAEKFWNKGTSGSNAKHSYELVTLQLDQLTKYVDPVQLPKELGGRFQYEHTEWMTLRHTAESIEQAIDNTLGQLNNHSIDIRSCALTGNPDGTSNQSFNVLGVIGESLSNVKSEFVDTAINDLHSKIVNSNQRYNPDFSALVPALKQSASRIDRAKKEVLDSLSAKRRELDRTSQLQNFEAEYSNISKFIASFLVRTEKCANRIGKDIEEAKKLQNSHLDLIGNVNNVEVIYENVLTLGKRLMELQPALNHIESYLKRLIADWKVLRKRLDERSNILGLAVNFHACYRKYMHQASSWILNVGVDPSTVLERPVNELQSALEDHKQFMTDYDTVYSETLSSLGQLQKKVNSDPNSMIGASKFLDECIKPMIKIHKEILNVWESRNLSIDQRFKALLLIPEMNAVLEWLDEYGEPFLGRKLAIGNDYESASAQERTHERFREIANPTYRNAHDLISTAKVLIHDGEIDAEQTSRAVDELYNRIRNFTQKVDLRTLILYMAKHFFNHYREIMEYYAKLEKRDEVIRIVTETTESAEQRKEIFQQENDRCDQAYEKIICEADGLISKLKEQRQLLKVRNEEIIENIQLLRADIEQKNSVEHSRWPAQREILNQAAQTIYFYQACEHLYKDIKHWEQDLKGFSERERIPDKSTGYIAKHHLVNVTSVEGSVRRAVKNAEKLKREIKDLGLLMRDKQPALIAVDEIIHRIDMLEKNVMKKAKEISGHLQSKELADKVRKETEKINMKMNADILELLQQPCLPRDCADADRILRRYERPQRNSVILQELVITYEWDTNACIEKLIDVDLVQTLRGLLEDVKTRYARYVQTRESREKLVRAGRDYYYCIETAIPAMETLERDYKLAKTNQRQNCEWEQNEELLPRRDNFSSRIANHMQKKPNILRGSMYAQQCADSFLSCLKNFEREVCRVDNRDPAIGDECRALQHAVLHCKRKVQQLQQRLIKLWQEVQIDLSTCKQACNLEILAKQVVDGLNSSAAKLAEEIPRINSIRNFSKNNLESILERVIDYQRSLEMNADIKDLREKMVDFNVQSYHKPFVDQVICQADAQCMQFESNLHEYVSHLSRALGRKVEELPRVKSKIMVKDQKFAATQQHRGSNDFTAHSENLKKLKDPMQELLASEMDYINDLRRCIEVYLKSYRMAESSLSASLQKKEREIFGNIENLYQFHADQLYGALSGYEHSPEEVGCCFYAYVEQLKEHYTEYILNNEENNSIINQPETIAVFEEIQRRHALEPNHGLQSMLIKPIQRITRYPMLLGQFMKYTVGNRKEMQTALDSMLGIPRAANDRVHLKNFEDVDKFRIGNFVMQDPMVVSESKRYFRRDKELQVFLFESNILFAKKEELSMKKIRYLCKFRYLLSDLHIVEHIEGDAAKFGLRKGSLPQGDQTTVLKAQTEESKKHWVKTLRELVLLMSDKNQLSDTESMGSTRYNESTIAGSMKSVSIAESQRLSNTSFDSSGSIENRTPALTHDNNNSTTVVEMRRPQHLNGASMKSPSMSNGLLSKDDQPYSLLSEMNEGLETPVSLACKRSTVSSTASSDDLPPAMETLSAVLPPTAAIPTTSNGH